MESPAAAASELVELVVDYMEIDATVTVEEGEGGTLVRLDPGEDSLGLLIGKQGRTLDALQHLAYQAALQCQEGVRVTVDVDGYRERRASQLKEEADRAVETVLEVGGEVELGPLTSAERRTVHEYLRDRVEVSTKSRGDEPHRCLVVTPFDS